MESRLTDHNQVFQSQRSGVRCEWGVDLLYLSCYKVKTTKTLVFLNTNCTKRIFTITDTIDMSMGVNIEVWRARMGCFLCQVRRTNSNAAPLHWNTGQCTGCLHAGIIIAVQLVIGGVESNPSPLEGKYQSKLCSRGEIIDLEKAFKTLKSYIKTMRDELDSLKTISYRLVTENAELR